MKPLVLSPGPNGIKQLSTGICMPSVGNPASEAPPNSGSEFGDALEGSAITVLQIFHTASDEGSGHPRASGRKLPLPPTGGPVCHGE